jgi:hypothetical protein
MIAGKPGLAEEHLSSSALQGKVERSMLDRLEKDLGVPLEAKRVDYEGGAYFEVDGVDPECSVFIEVFARIGTLKPGQKRKVGTDTLKLLALRSQHPDSRFILAFADRTAATSIVRGIDRDVRQRSSSA